MDVEPDYAMDGFKIIFTIILIILNGFFVAAEFALVKITKSKIKTMIAEKKAFATTAMWIYKRQNLALSACQLGITMASLALGWIGEPTIAHLITPWIERLGISSQEVIHGIAFAIAFSIITSLHIVIGEQVPKIYAIRKPGIVFLGSAFLLKAFYILLYPFMYVLNAVSLIILKWLGIEESDEHETPLNEEEIRASLSIAHAKGELSKNEHRLLNAVFRFDDEVARQIMTPRAEVAFLDINLEHDKLFQFITTSRHTRLPLCDKSLDNLIGVVHIKDLVGIDEKNVDLRSIARKPLLIPENILIAKLLHEFRHAKQHIAFIQDEHGTMLGIVTLEDVLEELVGNMYDEFDIEAPTLIANDGIIEIEGDTQIDELNNRLDTNMISEEADTISGLIVEIIGHKLEVGINVKLSSDVNAEILEVDGIRAKKVKLTIEKNKSIIP